MGSNRRYPDHGNRLMEQRELRTAAQKGDLHSLTPAQLDLDHTPVTVAPPKARIMGTAWLRFGTIDVPAEVRIDRWTDRAIGVTFEIDGRPMRCWVWQGAVRFANA